LDVWYCPNSWLYTLNSRRHCPLEGLRGCVEAGGTGGSRSNMVVWRRHELRPGSFTESGLCRRLGPHFRQPSPSIFDRQEYPQ